MAKNKNRAIASILVFVMLMSAFFAILGSMTPDASANTNTRISRLREERARLERDRREVQERINDYEFEKMSQMTQKNVLDDRMMLTWQEIENVTELIEVYEILIIEQELEVRAAQAREREQYKNYKARVRSMEENGIISYLEILFDSTSFSDLLARWDFINDIMAADARAYRNLIAAREETEAAEEALRLTRVNLEREKEELDLRRSELEEQIEEANILILQIAQTIEGEQALYEQAAAESRKINAEIDRLVEQARREEAARREAALRAARENPGGGSGGTGGGTTPPPPVSGSGRIMWPVSGRILSEFGPRGGRMHQGIDIGAPTGTPVVAGCSGTVITVSFNSGGWGHFIVIYHGGMTTLYAHLNSTSVRVGQQVSRGQQIGTVGATGNATTPHLHLEVRIGGVHVNPRTVLP